MQCMEFERFKPEHLTNLLFKQQATERMAELCNSWVGPDISLEKKVIIPPLITVLNVNLIVSKSDLPPIEINRGTFSALKWSVRSCHAQSGTDILFHHDKLSDEMIRDISEGKSVSVPVDVVNSLDRPVELEGDLMRFFWINESNRLCHQELRDVVGKELMIDGQEGKDWSFGDATEGIDEKRDPNEYKDLCLVLPLKEKYHIPSSTDILRVDSKKDLPNVLQEIPEGERTYFSVGETTKVKVGENIVVVLVTGGYDQGRHLSSSLIDSGYEGNIRTETLFGLKELDLFVYRK